MQTSRRLVCLSAIVFLTITVFHGVWSKPSPEQSVNPQQKVKLKVKVRVSPGPTTITRRGSNNYQLYDGSGASTASATSWGTGAAAASPSSSEKLYILRRKKNKNKYKTGLSSSASSASSESASQEPNLNSNDWVMTLQEAYKSNHYSKPKNPNYNNYMKTPVMVDTNTNQNFRANILLPQNPFMPASAQLQLQNQNFAGNNNQQKIFQKHPQTSSEYNKQYSKNQMHFPPPNSRADTFLSSLTSLTSYMNKNLPKIPNIPSALGKWAKSALSPSTHYSKPSSSNPPSTSEPTVHILDSQQSQKPSMATSESKISAQFAALAATRQATFDSLLSKLHRVEEIKASLPPRGSYTPYGERTIIMMKFPGLPARKRLISGSAADLSLGSGSGFSLGGIKPVSIVVDDWNTPVGRPVKLKDSDVGVIISQNYILQPDVSMNSHYNFERVPDPGHGADEADLPSTDMVTLLAKALAERNRLINTYARKAANGGMSSAPAPEPPFVLVHLETFTKKKNNTTPFGFVEEVESSYANGTIIYPTLDDPGILASTKFEFERIQDVENVFERPLQGYKAGIGASGGKMKPIVPLGLVEIQNYLRLMYQVHKDIHEGGRAKVAGLTSLAHTVERTPLAGSRPMDKWEVEQRMERYKENWLHTSTIGLRSISDFPPPPPKLPIPYPT